MPLSSCPLCGADSQTYLFTRHGARVSRCDRCGLVRTDASSATGGTHAVPDRCLAEYSRRRASRHRVLAIAAAGTPLLEAARRDGVEIVRSLGSVDVDAGAIDGGRYDGAIVFGELEKSGDPIALLERIHAALVEGAMIALATETLKNGAAKNPYYFDAHTIQSACLRAGFAEVEWRESGASLVATARRRARRERPLLSVVMPVFNERATFEETLQAVLRKECAGIDKEIVIVESHSTDGTRELVRKYESHPGVTVVLEDCPRGKGAAVRAGLERARGTIVMIQDADNEYDVNDYDALLEPIVTYRRAFVLGSRHMGSFKVRTFADQPAVSAFFNFGHVLFRTALNLLFRTRLNDPFTMYKVFRRDCLHRLKFECNRFDFDFELVIKLLRKGYVPLEVPVNYVSRSFKDGKKVQTFRDPITWIRALIKYRFAAIYDEGAS